MAFRRRKPAATGAKALFPGYFGLVMATGIISIAAYNLGYHEIGWALFFCNIVAYALFWTAGLYRLWWPTDPPCCASSRIMRRGPAFSRL
jgi:hypothetical protein